jgi:hypothetical protein
MELYWQKSRRGLDLIVHTDSGEDVKVGGIRETKRGIEAMAFTTGYDPGRSGKDLPSIEEARRFVESYEPWRDFFAEHLEVSPGVRPMPEEAGNQ